MRSAFGWSLLAAACCTSAAWGQAGAEKTRPRADNPAQGTPATKSADRATQNGGGKGAAAGRNTQETAAPAGTQRRSGEGATADDAGANAGAQHQGHNADQQIAAVLYAGNRNEVELAKFALEHAKSDDVKEFATMMVKEHTPMMEKLAKAAGPLAHGAHSAAAGVRTGSNGVKASAAGASAGTAATGAAATGAAGQQNGSREMAGQVNWVSIHSAIADQCLMSAKKELGERKGAEFDKAYLGHQIGAHMKMLDELKVFRTHVSSEIQQDLDKGITTTQEHLDHAKKLMEKHKDKADNS